MTHQTALIVDDEPDIRELLEITLIRMGLDTRSAATLNEALALLQEEDFSLCLTDMNLPDGNGIDLVRHIQNQFPALPVAMITAYGSVETAIEALKAGAFDFISKPVNLPQLRDLVSSALRLSDAPTATTKTGAALLDEHNIPGQSPLIDQLNAQISKLARSQAPVYISGESGSGKELAARMIHLKGPRAGAPFVPVNCGAIPSELMESEFFGHKKGSFSGAHEDKPGLFKAAHGGTLFLDEVADLPLDMQVKLLRAIQEKAVRAVGGQQEENIDVRVLSATHKDLDNLVKTGRFRQDLYYRINVIRLDVPALRDRRDDIPMLAERFLARIAEDHNIDRVEISKDAMQALNEYHFPGNVRELENIIERAFTLCENNCITRNDLQLEALTSVTAEASEVIAASSLASETASVQNHVSAYTPEVDIGPRPPEQSLEEYLESIERREIEAALHATKWNRTAAAKQLGISFRALRYRLKKLEMD